MGAKVITLGAPIVEKVVDIYPENCMTNLFIRLGCVLALVLNVASRVSAQEIAGSIRGTVVDATSGAVQGASVNAKQTETGLTRTATTDRTGAYILLELPVGHYQLQVEAKGFQKYLQQGITLNVNETATIPVHLVVGAERAGSSGDGRCATHPGHRDQPGQGRSGTRDFGSSAERPQFLAAGHIAARRRAPDSRIKGGRIVAA